MRNQSLLFAALVATSWVWSPSSPAQAQRITDTADQTLTLMVPFGTLTPGPTGAPSASQLQFRIRNAAPNGYRVTATATFISTLVAPIDGGISLAAGDVGLGITQITDRPQVLRPRVDTISPGFAYDPGGVAAINGMSPYTGAANGRATLNDIVNSPGLTLLTGPKIANNENLTNLNYLTVTMRFGVQREYFTPASMSAVITLTIANR